MIIRREDLFRRLGELSKDREIIGPVELFNKGVFYEVLKDVKDLYLGDVFAVEPIKKFFLSPSEEIFEDRFENGAERIIIGARPCEARALELLDKVFDSDYKDKFYLNNRKRSIIVGISCLAAGKNCFCTSMGGSPVEGRGMDVLLTRAKEDAFLAEIVTKRARDLFSDLGREPEPKDIVDLEKTKQACIGAVERKIKPPEISELDAVFEHDYWAKVSRPCLGCGVCTYLCPTCHCFDLVDEERGKTRCYDGCAFSDFTVEASGTNPRPTKTERYRQRVFHKFNYFRKNFKENLCVGCGRCIRNCPVKIDISEIVSGLPEAEKK